MADAEFEIDAGAAAVIAAGMQAVAHADGVQHEAELELVASFAAEIPAGTSTAGVVLTHPAAQELLVKSLVAVALADGHVSDVEREAILAVGAPHGVGAAQVDAAIHAMAREFLASFRGAHVFRDTALTLAQGLGIGADEAAAILDA
jgi:hypothetical protein